MLHDTCGDMSACNDKHHGLFHATEKQCLSKTGQKTWTEDWLRPVAVIGAGDRVEVVQVRALAFVAGRARQWESWWQVRSAYSHLIETAS